MSRRKLNPEEIRNPEHYFNRYIAKEVLKDQEKQAKYDDFFCSLEEKLEPDRDGQKLIAVNEYNHEMENQLAASSLLAWIDYIECPKLYHAICQMTEMEKRLLTFRFKYGLTQRETAKIMDLSQVAVHRCEKKLLKRLHTILSK